MTARTWVPWTEEELRLLIEQWDIMPRAEVARRVGRPVTSCYDKMKNLGLLIRWRDARPKKSPEPDVAVVAPEHHAWECSACAGPLNATYAYPRVKGQAFRRVTLWCPVALGERAFSSTEGYHWPAGAVHNRLFDSWYEMEIESARHEDGEGEAA